MSVPTRDEFFGDLIELIVLRERMAEDLEAHRRLLPSERKLRQKVETGIRAVFRELESLRNRKA